MERLYASENTIQAIINKIKNSFASKNHTHGIENGGTGATDAATALTNLGAASQTDLTNLQMQVDELLASVITVYTGSSTDPSDNTGEDGDIYLTV